MAQPASLSRNTAVMALGTLLSRITGFGRIFALGYALGFYGLADTYNLANNVPNIVYELVLGGILAGTLVPVFVHRFSDDEERGWTAVSSILTVTAVLLVVLTVVLFVGAAWIIDLYTIGNDTPTRDDQREVATFLLRLFVPQVAFYGFISLATALLHARRIFAPPMFAPILNNLAVIGVLLSLPHFADDLSLEAMQNDQAGLLFLGLGTTAGVAAMASVFLPYLRRVAGGKIRWHWEPKHEAVITVLRMSGWTVGFVIANQISLWVTLVLANGRTGDVSAFLSAYMFFILPHGIFTVSVVSALQPELAARWAQRDLSGFRENISTGTRLIMLVMIPAAVGYAILAHPIIELVLLHGAFSEESAENTANVVFWMALGLPAFSAFIFFTRAFQAMQDAKTVFYLYVLQNGINVLTAIPLYSAMGVNGLALSQSIAYAIGAVVALIALRRRAEGVDGTRLLSAAIRVVIASAVMGVAVYFAASLVDAYVIAQVATGILTGAITYVLVARLLRMPELGLLLGRRRAHATPDRETT